MISAEHEREIESEIESESLVQYWQIKIGLFKIGKVKMFKNSKHVWTYGWFCKYSCNERTADRIRQKVFKYTDIKEVSSI